MKETEIKKKKRINAGRKKRNTKKNREEKERHLQRIKSCDIEKKQRTQIDRASDCQKRKEVLNELIVCFFFNIVTS